MGVNSSQFEPSPNPVGKASPSCREQSVAPVDNRHVLPPFNRPDGFSCHIFGSHHHRIVIVATEQFGFRKSRAYVGKVDGEFPAVRQLLELLDVSGLESLRR